MGSKRPGARLPPRARWRERQVQFGLQGIERDLSRGAAPVKLDVQWLVELTTQSRPAAATHWSTRKMAAPRGVLQRA